MDAILIAIAVAVIVIVGLLYALLRGRGAGQRLNPLAEESRRRYADEWRVIETRFIDHPREAAGQADQLAVRILQERGATLEDKRRLPGELRQARRRAQGRDSEALRRSMQEYQAIVDDACGKDVREAAEQGRVEIA